MIESGIWAIQLYKTITHLSCQVLPHWCNYRPRSEASEGYVFTGICLSKSEGGGGRWHTKCNMGPGQNVYPLPPDQVRMSTPPSGTR